MCCAIPIPQVRAFLPVLESFGFTQLLRQNTGGKAFPQMIFDHWELIEQGDPDIFDPKTKTYQCVMQSRERKGMKAEMPVRQCAPYAQGGGWRVVLCS